jgi:hypothetical protein
MPNLALWLVLAAAMILIRANRTPRILLILMPLLIVNILWFLLTKMVNFNSSADMEMFNMMFNTMAAWITFLWLFAPKLGRYNPWIALFLNFAFIALFFLLGIVSYFGFGFPQDAVMAVVMLTMLALAMLLGFVLAGWRCRKHYGPICFMLWLAVWLIAACLSSMVVFCIIMCFVQETPIPFFTMLLAVAVVGLIFALFLYLINLPYMILAMRNSFFRERFLACLHLQTMPVTSQQNDAGQLNR